MLFVLHGANALWLDFSHQFTGDWSNKPSFPWRFIYLTVQCNLLQFIYGVCWLAESCCPGCSAGALFLGTHLVCGLGLYVFFNYYALIHFNKDLRADIAKQAEIGELFFRRKAIGSHFYFQTMNYIHGPLFALAGLPLIFLDRARLREGMLGVLGTSAWAVIYGCLYAGLCCWTRYISGFWVYPFMNDFTRWWHHVAFYVLSFALAAAFCLGYRTYILVDEGFQVETCVGVALAWAVTLACLALSSGSTASAGTLEDFGYKPVASA